MNKAPGALQPYGLSAFGFLILYQASVVGSVQTIPVLTPWIAQSLPALQGMIGFFVSWVILAALLCSGFVAVALHRAEAVRAGFVSIVVMAGGLAAITFSESFLSFVFAGFCIGLSYAVVNPVGSQIVAGLGKDGRNNVLFSIKQSSVSIGAGGAGLLLPPAADWLGWHWAIGFMVVVTTVIAWFGWLARPRDVTIKFNRARISLRDLIPFSAVVAFVKHPEGKRLAFASMTLSLTQYGTMAVYVVWLWGSLHVEAEVAGQMFFVAMMGGIAGRLFWGYLADLSQPARILKLQMTTGAVGALAMAFMPSTIEHVWLWIFSAVLGFVPMSWSGILLSEVTRAGKSASDARQGIITMTSGVVVLFYMGGLTGPAIMSAVYLLTESFRLGFAIFAVLFVVSLLLYSRRYETLHVAT